MITRSTQGRRRIAVALGWLLAGSLAGCTTPAKENSASAPEPESHGDVSLRGALRRKVASKVRGDGGVPASVSPVSPDAGASADAAPPADAGATGDAGIAGDAGAPAARALEGKVLCFGDSITQADWPGKIEPAERWVTQLGGKSAKITAVNAGRNGRTTTEGLAELPAALEANQDAAWVLIFLGVNDMKRASVGVVEKATTNMGKMVDLVRQKLPKAEVAILAPINVNPDKYTPFFKGELGPDTVPFMKALAVAYKSLAEKKKTRFVSLLDAVPPAEIEDGVHANGKGQIKIAEAVWKGLGAPPAK